METELQHEQHEFATHSCPLFPFPGGCSSHKPEYRFLFSEYASEREERRLGGG